MFRYSFDIGASYLKGIIDSFAIDLGQRATFSILSPVQGLICFGLITQGGARVASLALGYCLSGFQPYQFELIHLGCYGCDSRSWVFIGDSPFPAVL